MNKELLKAKHAIFKLIGQFHRPTKFDNGELYIYNYCESALEAAFNVLGIEEDYIPLLDFCKMWEDNNRALWAINTDTPFNGTTADIYYDIFKEDYESWVASFDLFDDEMSWINVKDKTPSENEQILFYDNAACEFELGIYEDSTFLNSRWIPCGSVTYWMPLRSPFIKLEE